MRKILSLLMLFCLSIGMALAQLPVVSQAPSNGKWADGTKWYTIKQNNTNSIALSNADANGYLKLNSTSVDGVDGYWCVVGNETDGYQFYNLQAGTTQVLGAFGSEENGRMKMYDLDVTKDGSNTLTKTFDIKKLDGQDGYAFVKNHGSADDWWNSRNEYLAYWNYSGAYAKDCIGSQYTFEEVDVTALLDDYKTNAKTALDKVSTLFSIDVAVEKAAIDAVESNLYEFAAIDAIVNSVAQAQYVSFRNSHTDNRANYYLGVDLGKGKGNGHATFNHLLDVWNLKYDGSGAFYLYNVSNEAYLGTPSSNGVLTVTPTAGYTFEVVENNKVKLKSDGQTIHLNNHAGNGPIVSTGWFLSNHDSNDPASQWYVETDFAAHVTTYKTTALTTLDSWKKLSVVFDGAPIDAVKTAVNGITTTNYATFAAIDAELKKVTDAVAAKLFTFQCTDTSDPARVNVYVAANASTGKAVGADNQDYNAIWTLQYAGGTSFYLYNELNKVYLGAPVDNQTAVALTETPVAAYSFEWIENNVVEMKCNGGTLHASNHPDDKLISYDGDQAASRWYVATIDIAADIQAILDGLTSEDYAETPALGQYPTSAYNALVAAKTTAKTVEEVEAAIAAFKASLNAPVYIISGVQDYANGKAIYYNGSNPEWRWDTKNAYNKAMWFRILGLTTPEFALDTEYNVVDMSGRNIYNKASIKFETVENRNDVYCLKYGTGDSDYLHLADHSNNLVTNWYRATNKDDGTLDSGASAFNVVYIGNSYDLAQLSDELFTAAADLAAVNVPNFSFATSVNNYNPDTKPALDAAIANRAEVLGKLSTAEEIAAAKSQLETAIDGVAINMPVNGKFYRVRCAGSGMKYLQSDLDDSNAEDIRLKVLSGAKSVAATFCYVDGALVSYTTGKSINAYRYDEVGTKSAVVFSEASNGKLGTYNITIGGRYIFGASDNNKIDSGSGTPDARDGYTWWLEDVNTIPVTITEAGYATFYAPVALTLPQGLTAYTVSAQSETSATLEEVEGVIPANTGVVLAGEANTYELTVAEAAEAVEGNLLQGSVPASYVTAPAYVLGYVNEEVGFYTAKMTEGKWLNNGFKAYLPKSVNGARFITFDFGTETAIDELNGENGNVKTVIYDLAGRRVQGAQKGIFIVNGVKVIK